MSEYKLTWLDALKKYNHGKCWCIPRKGSPEYDEVDKIRRGEDVRERNVARQEKALEQLQMLDRQARRKIDETREIRGQKVRKGEHTKPIVYDKDLYGRDVYIYGVVTDVFNTGSLEVDFFYGENDPVVMGGIYKLIKETKKELRYEATRYFGKSTWDKTRTEKLKTIVFAK